MTALGTIAFDIETTGFAVDDQQWSWAQNKCWLSGLSQFRQSGKAIIC